MRPVVTPSSTLPRFGNDSQKITRLLNAISFKEDGTLCFKVPVEVQADSFTLANEMGRPAVRLEQNKQYGAIGVYDNVSVAEPPRKIANLGETCEGSGSLTLRSCQGLTGVELDASQHGGQIYLGNANGLTAVKLETDAFGNGVMVTANQDGYLQTRTGYFPQHRAFGFQTINAASGLGRVLLPYGLSDEQIQRREFIG
jgi:hypothetical protein